MNKRRRSPVAAVLADADWMTPKRGRAYGVIFTAVIAAVTLGWLALSHGGLDVTGKPLGTDFTSFWAAARLAASEEAAAAYDPARHAAVQQAAFGPGDRGYTPFLYPPFLLLALLPFGLLPYLPALAAWLASTALACWRIIERILPGRGWLLFGYPASFLAIGHGQTAFLTTALFGGGVLAMASRPVLAGLCFGALAFKPQLGLLIPLLLVATGRWRVIAVAAATIAVLALVSLAAFGSAAWQGFFASRGLAGAALTQNIIGYQKFVSLFGGLRLLGAPLGVASAGQGLLSVVMAAAVIASRRCEAGAQGALLIAATCLATPYLLDYDLVLLAVPMAWLLAEGQRRGFRPWEKTTLMAAFVLPMLARPVATAAGVPLAPLVLIGLLLAIWRRGRNQSGPE